MAEFGTHRRQTPAERAKLRPSRYLKMWRRISSGSSSVGSQPSSRSSTARLGHDAALCWGERRAACEAAFCAQFKHTWCLWVMDRRRMGDTPIGVAAVVFDSRVSTARKHAATSTTMRSGVVGDRSMVICWDSGRQRQGGEKGKDGGQDSELGKWGKTSWGTDDRSKDQNNLLHLSMATAWLYSPVSFPLSASQETWVRLSTQKKVF